MRGVRILADAGSGGTIHLPLRAGQRIFSPWLNHGQPVVRIRNPKSKPACCFSFPLGQLPRLILGWRHHTGGMVTVAERDCNYNQAVLTPARFGERFTFEVTRPLIAT